MTTNFSIMDVTHKLPQALFPSPQERRSLLELGKTHQPTSGQGMQPITSPLITKDPAHKTTSISVASPAISLQCVREVRGGDFKVTVHLAYSEDSVTNNNESTIIALRSKTSGEPHPDTLLPRPSQKICVRQVS